MLSKKATLRAAELDLARCEARWSDMSERVRKYRKHLPDRADVEKTVLAEIQLHTLRARNDTNGSIYLDDGPHTIHLPPPFSQEDAESLSRLLSEASQGITDPERLKPIHLVQARVFCFSGQFQQALDLLEPLNLPSINIDPTISTSTYDFVLSIQQLALHGIALEHLDRVEDAIEIYIRAQARLFPLSDITVSASLAEWAEEALYRPPFLLLRLGRKKEAIKAFRAYHAFMLHAAMWLPGFRLHKRFSIIRHFSRQLAEFYHSGEYIPPNPDLTAPKIHEPPIPDSSVLLTSRSSSSASNPPSVPMSTSNSQDTSLSSQIEGFEQELGLVDAIYEELTHATHTFPKCGDSGNWRVLEMCDALVHHQRLIGEAAFSSRMTTVTLSARLQHQKRRRALVEALYRATEITFHSAHIVRLLAYALVDLGEYEEAAMAVKAYHALTEDRGNIVRRRDSWLQNGTSSSSAGLGEVEGVTQIVGVLLLGCRLALGIGERAGADGMGGGGVGAFGGEGGGDGEDRTPGSQSNLSRKYAEKALALAEEVKGTRRGVPSPLHSLIHTVLGRTHGRLSRLALGAQERGEWHEKAIQSLEQACSLYSNSTSAHYYLALEHALSRNIPAAISSSKAAIRLLSNPSLQEIPQGQGDERGMDVALAYLRDPGLLVQSWHLLTLLQTAQKDYAGALRLAGMAGRESGWGIPESLDPSITSPILPGGGMKEEGEEALGQQAPLAQGSPEEGEALLAAETSVVRLIDRVEGPSSALRRHPALFQLYGRVYALEAGGGGVGVGSEVGGGGDRDGGEGSEGKGAGKSFSRARSMMGGGGGSQGHGRSSGRSTLSSMAHPTSSSTSGINSAGNMPSPSSSKIRTNPSPYASSVAGTIPTNPTITTSASSSSGSSLSTEDSPKMATLSVYGATQASSVLSARTVYAPALRVTTRVQARRQRALHALTSLWLLSAEAYRKLGKYQEAWEAIEEAEGADGESAAVFCQMGMLYLAEGRVKLAQGSFIKALSLEPRHVPSMVQLAKAYLEDGMKEEGEEEEEGEGERRDERARQTVRAKMEREGDVAAAAEAILRETTEAEGWDCAEAWFGLGQVYERTHQLTKAKEAYWYALELEGSEPLRAFLDLAYERS
ncbi:MAG: hypothetical protein DHS80DRAFT_29314 [Piptocephalis tieghemiana]|nr:MAG: hypothetical protein DHS80DRAFT_29314 [Piptocephalis tieghemiana]